MDEKILVEFGNYILQRRNEGNVSDGNFYTVTHADLENFKHFKDKDKNK